MKKSLSATTWMDFECIMLSKTSQRKTHMDSDLTYMQNLISKQTHRKIRFCDYQGRNVGNEGRALEKGCQKVQTSEAGTGT